MRPGAGTRRRCTVVPSAPRSKRPAPSTTSCRWAPWIRSPSWSSGTPWARPARREPYVKVQLVPSQRKWKKRKTSARKGMATPYFNETFTFLVPFSQIQSVALVLAVWAWGPQFQAKPVSKVLLGAWASGQPLQHWADMLAHACRPSTACSRPGRWTGPWPCSPTCACPCLAPESSPGPRSPWAGPRVPCRLPWGPTIINAFSPMAVSPS